MRHAAQEIGAHTVSFRLVTQLLLPLDLRRERAHENAHDQHDRERQRIAVDRQVEFVKRVCKQVVHAHHADGRRQNAGPIPGGEARDEHHRQNEHGCGKRVIIVIADGQQLAHGNGAAHDQDEHERIAQPLRHALPYFLHKHPSFRTALDSSFSIAQCLRKRDGLCSLRRILFRLLNGCAAFGPLFSGNLAHRFLIMKYLHRSRPEHGRDIGGKEAVT